MQATSAIEYIKAIKLVRYKIKNRIIEKNTKRVKLIAYFSVKKK